MNRVKVIKVDSVHHINLYTIHTLRETCTAFSFCTRVHDYTITRFTERS